MVLDGIDGFGFRKDCLVYDIDNLYLKYGFNVNKVYLYLFKKINNFKFKYK